MTITAATLQGVSTRNLWESQVLLGSVRIPAELDSIDSLCETLAKEYSRQENSTEYVLTTVKHETRQHGDEHTGLAAEGDISGWIVLDCSIYGESEAGSLQVIDPRAGSEMVAVPGLPWGRPLILAPKPGAFMVLPGWHIVSAVPLLPNQRLTLVNFQAIRRE